MLKGRPPSGPALVERIEGSDEAKHRLEVILRTITGEVAIAEACEDLGISETRFHELRAKALEAALEGLEPAPLGRPPATSPEESSRLADLETEVRELRLELRFAQVREEIAAVMPHLQRPRKKKKRRHRGHRSPAPVGSAPSDDRRSGT